MKKSDLAAAVALALKLPRPAPNPRRKPASVTDRLAARLDRLQGYGRRRGPKGRSPLNCYPFGDWWRLAVDKAKRGG